MRDAPTPEQQADYLVRKLEQTIRDNRTVKGMSFRTWQNIAREEIANAIRDAEKRHFDRDKGVGRLLLVGSSSLVTIGFWGAVVAVDRAYGGPAAIIFLIAGAALAFVGLDYGMRRFGTRWMARRRLERMSSIESLDRRIKRMEADMKKKHDRLKEKMEEIEV